jgi:hypothetical protein
MTARTRRLAEFRNDVYALPCFGRPTGFVVNYAPDRAVRFDLDGQAIAILPQAFRVGEVHMSLSDAWPWTRVTLLRN